MARKSHGFRGESMNRLNLDFETRSAIDLRKVGAYRYAEDPSTWILIVGLSLNEGPVTTWDVRQPTKGDKTLETLRKAITEGWEIHAYNSQFEFAILKYVATRQFGFPIPDVNQMRCSSATCRAAGLPPGLGRCAEFLKLPIQKDKMGLPLIQKFSVPQKEGLFRQPYGTDETFTVGGERHNNETAFQKFVDYCARDVETEMLVSKTMGPFALKGQQLDSFLLDARINDRGVPVDVEALKIAHALCEEYRVELTAEFRDITGINPTQNKKALEWLKTQGYRGCNINKESRDRYGKDPKMTVEGRRGLRILAEISYAAVKKIPAMLDCVMQDGKIRGSFFWCGAQKTGRWSCKTPQWQNMKKPEKELKDQIENAYQDMKAGAGLPFIKFFYGNPYNVLASLTRYFVRYELDDIYDSDFSSVEAKILPKLIGCQRILDSFGTDGDLYSNTAKEVGDMFGETLTRSQGKTLILATQFAGGATAVFNATGKTWSMPKCKKVVELIRERNPEFSEAWKLFASAFSDALDSPGRWFPAGEYVSYGYTKKAPFPRMAVLLPSGRKIILPFPRKEPITMVKIDPTKKGVTMGIEPKWERLSGHLDEEEILDDLKPGDSFLNPHRAYVSHFHTWELIFHGHTTGVNYGAVRTYGGDLLQSVTQATGLDLLVGGVLEAEAVGFEPFFVVHDQCLTPAIGDKDIFTQKLCTVPEWFEGFPLDAETDQVRSYCKS